jgi:putative spermidine/putrescine transport system substrate-binding protein
MGYLPTVENAPLSGKVGEQLAFPEPRPKLVTVDYAAMSKAMSDLNDWWLKNIQHS